MTFAKRRIILRKVQNLVNELIQVNESAARAEAVLLQTNLADVAVKVNAMLAPAGLSTTTDGTGDKISDSIVAILHGAITDTDAGAVALSWTYVAG